MSRRQSVLLIVIALIGGPIAAQATGHGNNEAFPHRMLDEFSNPRGPNNDFWFGVDSFGQDLFVRTMYGARTSLLVGVVAAGIAVLIRLVVGLLAGRSASGLRLLGALTIGMALIYVGGLSQLWLLTREDLGTVVMQSVVPFLPGDLLKIGLAWLTVRSIRSTSFGRLF